MSRNPRRRTRGLSILLDCAGGGRDLVRGTWMSRASALRSRLATPSKRSCVSSVRRARHVSPTTSVIRPISVHPQTSARSEVGPSALSTQQVYPKFPRCWCTGTVRGATTEYSRRGAVGWTGAVPASEPEWRTGQSRGGFARARLVEDGVVAPRAVCPKRSRTGRPRPRADRTSLADGAGYSPAGRRPRARVLTSSANKRFRSAPAPHRQTRQTCRRQGPARHA